MMMDKAPTAALVFLCTCLVCFTVVAWCVTHGSMSGDLISDRMVRITAWTILSAAIISSASLVGMLTSKDARVRLLSFLVLQGLGYALLLFLCIGANRIA